MSGLESPRLRSSSSTILVEADGRRRTRRIVCTLPEERRRSTAIAFVGLRVEVTASQLRSADSADVYVGEVFGVLRVIGDGYVLVLDDVDERDAEGRTVATLGSVALKLTTVRSIRQLR